MWCELWISPALTSIPRGSAAGGLRMGGVGGLCLTQSSCIHPHPLPVVFLPVPGVWWGNAAPCLPRGVTEA